MAEVNKLIYENIGSLDNKAFNVKQTKEGMRLHGVFGVCGVRNNNNRVYEKNNYKAMVCEMQNRIKTGSILGELEHPATMNITLENVSHKIDEISIDENGQVTGTITLLNTPKGKIAQAIVEGGAPLFISSRATGSVDGKGNVKLEHIQTYDLVGSPGFSQAKLTLCESLSDNQYGELNESSYWVNLPQNEDGTKLAVMPILEGINDNNDNMDEIKSIVESLLTRVEILEKENAELKSANESAHEYFINVAAPIIEKWVTTEYGADLASKIDSYINEELMSEVKSQINEAVKTSQNQIAEGVEKWVTTEFAGVLSQYINEELMGTISNYLESELVPGMKEYLVEKYTPALEKYLTEEYAGQITKWITEEYSPVIEKYLTEEVIPSIKNDKMSEITKTLESLESLDTRAKYSRKTQINENRNINEPKYIAEMPEDARIKWNIASDAVKESIQRKAKIYNFNSSDAIQQFWENVSFEEPAPRVNETHFVDNHQQKIMESIRAYRASKNF